MKQHKVRYQAPTDEESIKKLADTMSSFGYTKQTDIDRFIEVMESKSILYRIGKWFRAKFNK